MNMLFKWNLILKSFAIAVSVSFLIPLHAYSSALKELRFEHLLTGGDKATEGMASIGAISTIIQDNDGYMWFGGESGLVRYDAHDFKYFQPDVDDPNSVPSAFISDFVIDHDGVFWIASGGGLAKYNKQSNSFTNYLKSDTDNNSLSSNIVNTLAVGPGNELYIGTNTGLNVLSADRSKFDRYYHRHDDSKSLSANNVRDVLIDKQGTIWLATDKGIDKFNPTSRQFERIDYSSQGKQFVIRNIAIDQQGNFWLAFDTQGLGKWHPVTKTFRHYQYSPNSTSGISGDQVSEAIVDKHNNVWIAIDHGGLAKYERDTDSFYIHKHNADKPYSISTNQVRTLYQDKQGNMWVGNFPTGINFHDSSKSKFKNLAHNPLDDKTLSSNGILYIYEDSDKNLWIGTEAGLDLYDRKNGDIKRYVPNPKDKHSLQFGAIVSIVEDKLGDLWVASWSGGLYRFNKNEEKFYQYLPEENDPNSYTSRFPWATRVDKNNELWVGAINTGGLSKYDYENDNFINYGHQIHNPNSLIFNSIRDILADSYGNLWIATLNGLDEFNPQKQVFTHYLHTKENTESISGNVILTLFEDSQKTLWVSTEGAGLNRFNRDKQSFTRFDVENGLPSSTVASILEDHEGNLWLGTTNGLARFDRKKQTFSTYYQSDGIAGNNHNRNARYLDSDGTIYVGTTEGITVFHPSEIANPKIDSAVEITGLSIMNTLQDISGKHSPIKQLLNGQRSLKLNHKQVMFSFDFTLLNFRSSHRNEYAYILEGFDKDWNHIGYERKATYTSIPPGNYVFKVKARNRSSNWTEIDHAIEIKILPPPWLSWWAYIIYVILGIAALSLIIHIRTKQVRREQAREKAYSEKLLKLDKLKSAFLNNTSHELKTPLNGIVSITEDIRDCIDNGELDEAKKSLKIINHSGKRLDILVNNLLDFVKLADNKLSLQKSMIDIHLVVQDVLDSLEEKALAKNLRLINKTPTDAHNLCADPQRIHQILSLLIDNAIKFSDKESAKIIVGCTQIDDTANVFIQDEGRGIAQDKINEIFSSFSQIDFVESRVHDGIGMGLSIAQRLIQLHGGELGLQTCLGEGSTFTVKLPLDTSECQNQSCVIPFPERTHNPQKFTALVVDDEPVNRIVLTKILQRSGINTLEAEDGEKALELIKDCQGINLVLLDIMMPNMSGYEVCESIRKKYNKDELPVLFITAKSLDEAKEKAIKSGGNHVIAKPISKEQVINSISNYL